MNFTKRSDTLAGHGQRTACRLPLLPAFLLLLALVCSSAIADELGGIAFCDEAPPTVPGAKDAEAAATDTAAQAAESPPDSPLEDLNYAAVRVPAAEDFLRRLPADELPESAFQSLHEIFSFNDDAFLIDPAAGRWQGLRQTALDRLLRAGFSVQQAWNRTAMASADVAWSAAVSRGDAAAAARVAAGWPLSEYDLRLTLLRALEAWHSGESATADATITRTLNRFRGTALQSRAETLLRPLKNRLQPAANPSPSNPAAPPPTVSTPWPRSVWNWRELVRQQDAERQQAESTLLLSMDPDTAARMRSFELWKPTLWGPWIISRAPSRLVALDRRTGAECWWLSTDQALRDPSAPHHEDDSGEVIWQLSPGNQAGIIDSKLDSRWGMLAVDDESLWLVDRLPVLSGLDPPSAPFTGGRLNPWLPDELQPDTGNVGSRLICLRRSVTASEIPVTASAGTDAANTAVAWEVAANSPPDVAWIIGEGVWQYHVATPADPASDPVTPTRNAPAAAASLSAPRGPAPPSTDSSQSDADHPASVAAPPLFASGPAVHEHRLLILSESPETEQLDVLCLSRSTGRTLWRQPLLQLALLHSLREAAGGVCQSVCLVCDDTVICSLEGAILAAVDLGDGHCRWMLPLTRLQSADAGALPMLFPGEQPATGVPTRCPFLPVASRNVVICAAPGSMELQAIEARTGRVLWRVPRIVSGATGPGGSPDLLAAGLFDDRLILVGERHCRCLYADTGTQLWVVETGLCSGTPLCSPSRLVLPQLDGRPLVIDLQRGRRIEQSSQFLPSGAGEILGSLAGDDEYVFSGTAGVLTAWRRADVAAAGDSGVNASVSLDSSPGDRTSGDRAAEEHALSSRRAVLPKLSSTEKLQALLLNGDGRAAEDLRNRLQLSSELLSEAWLLERGTALDQSPPHGVAPPVVPLPAALSLTPSGQLRLQLIEAVATGRPPADDLPANDGLQQLSSLWSVSLPALRPIRLPQPATVAAVESLPLGQLRRLAESACLHPGESGSPETLSLLVQELSRRGLTTGAELVAAAWWLEAMTGSGGVVGAEQAAEWLRRIRGLELPAIGSPVGLQSASAGTLVANAILQLRSTDAAAADPEGEDISSAAPWWLPHDVRLAVATETGRSLLILDRAGAGLLDQFPSESNWKSPSIPFRQTSHQLAAPAIIPLLNSNRLQMTALQPDGRIRVLWSEDLPGAALAVLEPQFGPLWPGGLIMHFADQLSCRHPLTGRLLWQRQLPQEFDHHGLLPSRCFGDHIAVALLGSDGDSCESYRASDGRFLGRWPVEIGRGTECGTVGRLLIYTDLDYRLHLFDPATGTERLQQEPPVIIAATQTESLFASLPGNRILTITNAGELVLIDLESGQQLFRTRLPPAETMAAVSSLQAVESGGQLLVEVENIGGAAAGGFAAGINLPFRQQAGVGLQGMGGIGEELRRAPRGVDLEIDDGLLCCLDAATGQLLWVQPRYDCRLQRVAGDPTDLVILTELRYGRSQDADGGLAQHVNLEVLHARTGEVLLKAGRITMSGVHSAWHDARASEIRLMATDGAVVIRRQP
ncbi:MAG: PQQ-binding-like beta-propeller repeat protein [Planctomycetota bacterium]